MFEINIDTFDRYCKRRKVLMTNTLTTDMICYMKKMYVRRKSAFYLLKYFLAQKFLNNFVFIKHLKTYSTGTLSEKCILQK